MAKDFIDSDQQDSVSFKALDVLTEPVSSSARKLDADEYVAEDLDGVTESLFGSGNMNYLGLQARQTDQALSIEEGQFSDVGSEDFKGLPSSASDVAQDLFGDGFDLEPLLSNEGFSPIQPTLGGNDLSSAPELNIEDGNFTGGIVGSVGASALSSDAGAFSPSGSGLRVSDALNGLDGDSGDDGTNGNDGNDGSDGLTPELPEIDDVGKIICKVIKAIDVDIDIDVDIADTVNQINNTLIILGDQIGDVTNIANNLIETLNTTINNVIDGDIIDVTVINDIVTNLKQTLIQKVKSVLNQIEETGGDVTEIVNNVLGDGLKIAADVDIVDIITGDVEVFISDTLDIDRSYDLDINFSEARDLVEAFADLPVMDMLSDTMEKFNAVISDLKETIQDTVETVSDIDSTEDIIETLESVSQGIEIVAETIDESVSTIIDTALGITDGSENDGGADSDVTLDVATDLLENDIITEDIDVVLDPVEDVLGDVDTDNTLNLDLLDGVGDDAETDNDAGDTDIVITNDIDVSDIDLVDISLDIELDPVEQITGDIDLESETATDLLHDTADALVNEGEGGTGDDTLLSDIGETLEDVGDTLTDPLADITPDEPLIDLNASLDFLEEGEADLNNDDEADIDSDILDILSDDGGLDSEIETALEDAFSLSDSETGDDGLTDSESLSGEDDVFDWTETTITDDSEFLGDLVSGSDGGDIDILPDPSGTVAEGIGVLDVEPELDVSSIGGLFG